MLIVAIITVLSQVFGFIREMLFANYYGLSGTIDAFQIAETVPALFTQTIINIMPFALIPLIIKASKEGCAIRNKVVNTSFFSITIVMIIASVVVFLLATPFIRLIGAGLPETSIVLSSSILRILVANILLLSIAALSTSIINSMNYFIVPALLGLTLNVVMIIGLLFLHSDIRYIAVVNVASSLIMSSGSLLYFRKVNGAPFQLKWFDKSMLKTIFLAIFPVVLISIVTSLLFVVDKSIASHIGVGSVTALSYSYKVINIPINVFVTAVARVRFPALTESAAKNDYAGMQDSMVKLLRLCFLTLVPLTALVFIVRIPIVSVLFERGAFNASDVALTAECMGAYAFGMIGLAINALFVNLCYATQKLKTIGIIAVVQLVLTALLNILMSKVMGVSGIGVANAITVTVLIFVWLAYSRKYLNVSVGKKVRPLFLKSLVSTLVGVGVVYVVMQLFTFSSSILSLAVYGGLFIIIYFLFYKCWLRQTSAPV